VTPQAPTGPVAEAAVGAAAHPAPAAALRDGPTAAAPGDVDRAQKHLVAVTAAAPGRALATAPSPSALVRRTARPTARRQPRAGRPPADRGRAAAPVAAASSGLGTSAVANLPRTALGVPPRTALAGRRRSAAGVRPRTEAPAAVTTASAAAPARRSRHAGAGTSAAEGRAMSVGSRGETRPDHGRRRAPD